MKAFLKKGVVAILTLEARAVVRKYKPRIVAITGSVGKTSTKDAVYAVLAQSFHVRRSDKSFNSEVGLPLTILGCPNAWNNPIRWLQNILDGLLLILFPTKYPEWLVLEIGADRPGDIRAVAKWLPVDIAVITHLPEMPVHVEYFNSPTDVVEEKASIINALKQNSTLVLYADDERTRSLASRAKEHDARVITFGISEKADVRGGDFAPIFEKEKMPNDGVEMIKHPVGMRATIIADSTSEQLEIIGTIGKHQFISLFAAAAVGIALQKKLPVIVGALRGYVPPRGRMRLIPGIKQTLIIDDTYNASPAAVAAALDTLPLIQAKRKIVVLGDMLELGKYSVEEHRKVGMQIAKVVDLLLTVGFRAHDIASGALDEGLADAKIMQYEDSQEAGNELQTMLEPGDCVLVKGSQSMRMEKVVKEIMAEPEKAGDLLVRQEVEWEKR